MDAPQSQPFDIHRDYWDYFNDDSTRSVHFYQDPFKGDDTSTDTYFMDPDPLHDTKNDIVEEKEEDSEILSIARELAPVEPSPKKQKKIPSSSTNIFDFMCEHYDSTPK